MHSILFLLIANAPLTLSLFDVPDDHYAEPSTSSWQIRDLFRFCKNEPNHEVVLKTRDPEVVEYFSEADLDSSRFTSIVVIPDVHGDAELFIESLWIGYQQVEGPQINIDFGFFKSSIMETASSVEFLADGKVRLSPPESKLSTLGDKVAVVQLGDIMDRGTRPFLCYQILAAIETVIGWRLIQLFGNHEMWIYNPECQSTIRSNCGKDIAGFNTRWNSKNSDIPSNSINEFFAPDRPLWQFIFRNSLVMARIGRPIEEDEEYEMDPQRSPDSLFVHAGLDSEWLMEAVEAIEEEKWMEFEGEGEEEESEQKAGQEDRKTLESQGRGLINDLNSFLRNSFLSNPDSVAPFAKVETSPVNTRMFGRKFQEGLCDELDDLLMELNISRIIVGHTIPHMGEPGVRDYCDNRFFITDVMISRGFQRGGQPFAFVMQLDEAGQIDWMTGFYEAPRLNPQNVKKPQNQCFVGQHGCSIVDGISKFFLGN